MRRSKTAAPEEVFGMASPVPIVAYLVSDGGWHLEANECTACAARYFDRRTACANPACGGLDFRRAPLPTTGVVKAFTIVSFAPPGVSAPFVAVVVDCGGTTVRGTLVGVEATPDMIQAGMAVRLTTYPLGADRAGTEAIGFAFEPVPN